MKEFFHSVKFKIIIALTAVLIGAMIYSVTTGGYSSGSNYLFEVIFEPVRNLSSSISDKVSRSLDMVINAEKYYNENQQLKAQLNALYNDVIDYDKVLEENKELRVMLELKEEYNNYKFSPPCTVIARTTNDPYGSFTVDKGANDGIKPGDPVVTETGIVGVCFEVSPSTSKVRTLYSPKTAVGVYTVRTKAEGIAEGGYDLAINSRIRMSYISKESDIREGDVIVTSGSANYPAGQLIGTVESVEMEQNGLSKFAVIIPAEDPNTITSVFVITDYSLDEVTAIKTGQKAEDSQ
ncbi:MAG: rod shape-determining protein MreC [Oscillospiraceae bacterium]|nr:rod shape-determining protein MreC [Oscillospiraceae bacterium]MCI7499927.1 rod shape-determining protein MreC [Oscillospiraceae bacterium]MDD7280245.1 rod shape-determining protein MreC [Oscillospiraceae bacterium]MDY2864904.1 rod shape-determining protein MreC [Oscillospiraceae bacterium]